MRGWMLLMLIVLATSVFAANETICSDTDNGGASRSDAALKTRGDVKYGITTQSDVCLTSEEGVSTNSSKYLKEYFCRDGQRASEVYDCVKLGFSGCVNGKCEGTASNTNTTTTTQTTQSLKDCGNKIVEKDKGEQCDPPASICFGRSTKEYGMCQNDCTCKISAAALKNLENEPAVCGDDYRHPAEDCEKDADCPDNYVCSSCKCVKQLTAEEIEALKKSAAVQKEEAKDNVSKEIEEKYVTPELPEVNLTATNFSDDAGIKATSGIANFFKKIFGWIGALFS